jgi:hypothetical protein
MERGRPRKRSETTCGAVKRTGSKRSKSAEKRAQDQLPTGWKAAEAVTLLEPTEVVALQKQALAQAARFEVLRKEDVDNLSKVSEIHFIPSFDFVLIPYPGTSPA